MFSGRNYELQYLNNYYERDGSQIMVLYGRISHTSTRKTGAPAAKALKQR